MYLKLISFSKIWQATIQNEYYLKLMIAIFRNKNMRTSFHRSLIILKITLTQFELKKDLLPNDMNHYGNKTGELLCLFI